MKNIVKIKQHDITDCGAACLTSIAAHYKLRLPIARVRQYTSTDTKGTNVLGLVQAATGLGFTAKGVKGTFESLFKIPTPAIAHVVMQGGLHHFVVIYGVTKQYIIVMDPADGKKHNLLHEEFKKQWSGVLVILMPGSDFKKGNEKKTIFSRFYSLIRPHKSILIQALVGALIYTVLGLSTSLYVQKIVDHVLPSGNYNLMNLMGVLMIVLLLIQVFIGSFKGIFALKTGQQIDAGLILGYYKHLLTLPQHFFDTRRTGEIISRVNDAVKIRFFINDVALNLIVNVCIVVFSFALMFSYYWKLALITLCVLPLYTLVYFIVNAINRKQQRKVMEHTAELESQLVESINAAGTIKRFGVESYANLKTETKFIALLRNVYGSNLNSLFASQASEFISRLFTIILLWAGAFFVLENLLTAGELLSFYALLGYLTGPATSLIGMNKTIQEALIAADRLFEIMDLEREERENKIEMTPEMSGDIQFSDVCFRYGSRAAIFENLTLSIPAGKVTAIVGESGSGKSTLMSLLQNMYPLTGGNISIANHSIKHISHQSLRKIVSVVPQKVDLFSGTVIENIAVGVFQPDMKRILRICHDLGITQFVEKLPNGFLSQLGENGANLSGGQRQRIAIARALYREPEILIMDEATSSLDTLSEKYVQKTIEKLRAAHKTVIIISHRLSSIMHADKIIVLESGKVTEEGTHQQLKLYGKKYSSLWAEQFPAEEKAIFNMLTS
ncbi:peptidase domain-containing ABC transporter [Rhodocytophaga rosea]|uniref:Peptidase domain-containing ABC transporter n=1 Tax=Rhodocytophaga rosea TaxID=2704465 RepID=A0A6C0GS16_9BACT|nr:peptidase domain-containing ABC transporter [Rhodocytophaga rosea]QHT65263.1 peptidase domain-containing ABC transporter [Rhodocytophaga rosea]QHT70885.1 peptidase domain-containing ABC transporter [Rhodocytophaga rosea]